jgi:hypothetical protein
LVSDDPVVHETTHDTHHTRVEEKLRREAGRLERERKKVTLWATVRRRAAVEMREQAWPECVSARGNQSR